MSNKGIQAKPSRRRDIVAPKSDRAHLRQDLIANSIKRVKEAGESGFYLEAITIIESLIMDRLESRLQYHDRTENGFMNFASIAKKLSNIAPEDAETRNFVDKELKPWFSERNKALHEISKMSENDTDSFAVRYARLEHAYLRGEELRKRLFAMDKKHRKRSTKPKNSYISKR